MYGALDSYVTQPEITDLESLYDQFIAQKLGLADGTTLDIGCGETPRNLFHVKNVYGLDIREDITKNIRYADLTTEALPFSDNMFDYITAYDFLEHIPKVIYVPERRFPFIQLMNEIYRKLKSGGLFLSRSPFYPISSAFTDPTHVNVITADIFLRYFDDQYMWAKMYGFEGGF